MTKIYVRVFSIPGGSNQGILCNNFAKTSTVCITSAWHKEH